MSDLNNPLKAFNRLMSSRAKERKKSSRKKRPLAAVLLYRILVTLKAIRHSMGGEEEKYEHGNDKWYMPRTVSLTTKNWNKLFERTRLGDFLPYNSHDPQTGIYHGNDNEYGAVFYVAARMSMGGETSKTIMEIIEKLDRQTHFQIVMHGSNNGESRISRWEHEHLERARMGGDNTNVILKTTKAMADFHRANHFRPVGKQMSTALKMIHVYICLKSADYKELKETKSQLKDQLAANSFYPADLPPQNLKEMLYEVFNSNHFKKNDEGDILPVLDIPEYETTREFNRQLIAGDTVVEFRDTCVVADGRYWKTLSPQKLSEYAHLSEFGAKIGDYLSAVMDSNQFHDGFILTTNIKRLPKKETNQVETNHSVINGQPWPHTMREFHKRKEESGGIIDRVSNNEELYIFDMNVCVSGQTEEAMNANAETIISYWQKGGKYSAVKLNPNDGVHQLCFMASLPLGVCDEYFQTTKKYYKLFAEQLTQYLPLESDFPGTNSPNMVFYSRRGQTSMVDLFESDASMNSYLIATSGAGKSVLLNNIAYCSYARGDQVFIVDLGGSYRRQCEVFGGKYIEPNPKKPICINPFSDISGREHLRDDLDYLSSFVYSLGASKSAIRSDEVEKYIKTYLQSSIMELFEEFGDELEITNIRDRLQREADERLQDFAAQLGSYCRGGIYEGFLCGKNELDMSSDFIVAELQQVEDEAEIRDPILMLLFYHIGNRIYKSGGIKQRRMQMIFDEFHKFLGKNPRLDSFVEQAYRRARKSSASIIVASQGFDDLYSPDHGLTRAGSTIINNSPWKFFMKQTATSINLLVNSGVFNFTSQEEELLRSITTVKGQFSEMFMITPSELKTAQRLVMDKFFYYLTTTDPGDKEKIAQMMEEYGVPEVDAIELLVQQESDFDRRSKKAQERSRKDFEEADKDESEAIL
jgi:conjugal transfer ATP-binding protein TraC